MKYVLFSLPILLTVFITLFFPANTVSAQFGSCSEYGYQAFEQNGYCVCRTGYVMGTGYSGQKTCVSQSQYCTDSYGYNARATLSGGCECRSGYQIKNTYSGQECVSSDSLCKDSYGLMSKFSSLTNSCDCLAGYTLGTNSLGKTQCISDDQACKDQLGIHSRSTYGDQCQCSYGYIIDGGKCVNAETVCRNRHGIYASYNDLGTKCECDSGYTFNDAMQCVKKQNSAYFTLLDISDDGDELLIQSQQNYQNYIIEYGIGCWDYAIETYEGLSLVVNMGTDFSVNMFDDLVLPNHNQNCSLMGVERTSNDSFPEAIAETYVYTPPVQEYAPSPAPTYNPEPAQPIVIPNEPEVWEENPLSDIQASDDVVAVPEPETTTPSAAESDVVNEVSNTPRFKEGIFSRFFSFIGGLFN